MLLFLMRLVICKYLVIHNDRGFISKQGDHLIARRDHEESKMNSFLTLNNGLVDYTNRIPLIFMLESRNLRCAHLKVEKGILGVDHDGYLVITNNKTLLCFEILMRDNMLYNIVSDGYCLESNKDGELHFTKCNDSTSQMWKISGSLK